MTNLESYIFSEGPSVYPPSELKVSEKSNPLTEDHVQSVTDNSRDAIYLKRLQILRLKCMENKTERDITFHNPENVKLYFAHNLKLAFCKIPKCGSTFWMQIFLTLTAKNGNRDVFGRERVSAHSNTYYLRESYKNIQPDYTVFMMTRNPYSRLYSAYIDKIYLPGFWNIAADIARKHNISCGKDVTFEQFLLYVANGALAGYGLDPHWSPAYRSCMPCDVPYGIISKQETYSEDVEYILSKTNTSEETRNMLLSYLYERHTNNSITEITKIMLHHASPQQTQKSMCITPVDFFYRLWISFQIQGYIHQSVPFPRQRFSKLRLSARDKIVNLCLEGSAKHPMIHGESQKQRRFYLKAAYSNVKKSTIELIQRAYALDFKMFDYPLHP